MARTSGPFLTVIAFVAAMFACPAWAQSRSLSQFQHTAWSLESGAPSQINALAQTKDGYLWLGTANGLFRFDGVTFQAYQPSAGQQLPHTSIQSLTATADGGLWIGYTLGDTSFLKNGVLTTQRFGDHPLHAVGTVYSIINRRDGTTWATTGDGPIRLQSGVWQDADEVQGLQLTTGYNLFEDTHGTLWMATDDFAYRLPPGAQRFEKTALDSGADAIFTETPDGVVWVADQYGIHDANAPLERDGRPRSVIPFKDSVLDFRPDDSGALWAIGAHTGVTRVEHPRDVATLPLDQQRRALERFSSADGLTSERGTSTLEDREGNIWVATADGLDRFRPSALIRAPLPSTFAFYAVAAQPDGSILVGTEKDGLQRLLSGRIAGIPIGQESRIPCIYRAPDGKLWLGGYSDLGYLENGRYTAVPVPPEVKAPGRDTQAMTSGPDGDLWMQTASALGILRLHHGEWTEVPATGGKQGTAVVMATDHTGRVWAGYMQGVLKVFDGPRTKRLTQEQGLSVGNVLALHPSAEGMWIGGEHGLNFMAGDRPVELRFAGDTRIEGISGIMRMDDGSLWLNTLPGILQIPKTEVEQALTDSSHPMKYRLFNYLDGLSGRAPQLRPMPSIVRGVGTTLWFTTTNGVVSLDTAHIYINAVVPPVVISGVLVDGTSLDPSTPLNLSSGAKDLQIDYTALSLSMPERVRFRYKLEGYDKDWQDAGTRRQAFYPHLPPGHYAFHVIACNNDGLWNETGASVSLYLPPTFFQSWYFKALLVTLFVLGTWLIYFLRMRQETARLQTRMQERFSERERIARDLHDTLFQSVEGSLLHLNAVTSRLPLEQQVKDQLRQAYGELDRVMGQARSLVFDLRQPVDAQDLASTILLFAEEIGGLSEAQVGVQVRGTHTELKPAVHDEILKIVKECIWNAFRHAKSQHIAVAIHYSARCLEISVKDDGVGIDPAILEHGARDGHWGLPGLRERASKLNATLSIRNGDGAGAEVVLRMKAADAYRSPGWIPYHWWRLSQGAEEQSR